MVEIDEIRPEEADDAKDLLCRCFCEFWGDPDTTVEEMRQFVEERRGLRDLDDIEAEYFQNRGTFLVVRDDGEVVGTGALRRFEDDICELCRMWLLPEYRRQGLGTRLAERLLDFAREQGYETVRLHTVSDLEGAIQFYERLGFHHIERYKETDHSDVFMEMDLEDREGGRD